MGFHEIRYAQRSKTYFMPNEHSHSDCFELICIIEGRMQIVFSDSFIDISAPALVVIPPGEDHKTNTTAIKRYVFYIAPDSLDEFELNSLCQMSKKAIVLPLRAVSLLDDMYMLEQTNEDDRKEKQLLIFGFFIYLILSQKELKSNSTSLDKRDGKFIIAKIVNYIEHNYQKKITYETLSKEFSVSASTLRKHFKMITDKTIGEYILRVRIENAKVLLTWSNKSIEQIASETGFYNASYLTKCFSREVGMTPLKYRKREKSL